MKYHQTSYKLINPQKITASTTGSVVSTILGSQIETLRLVGTVDVWFNTGSSTVVASSTGDGASTYLPLGLVEYINPLGKGQYIAVLADSSSGLLIVTECTQ